MDIKITHEDSLVAYTILSKYLLFLDTYIRQKIQADAEENKSYLQDQLIHVMDPLLRARLQELIAKEVEKQMIVSKEAFRVIDETFVSKSFKEKKLYPIVFAFLFGGVVSFLLILIHALGTAEKDAESKEYLEGIKKEIFRIPFMK